MDIRGQSSNLTKETAKKHFRTSPLFTRVLCVNCFLQVRDLEQKCLMLKTDKMELEIVADKTTFLESQNSLLDARFKETVER